MTQHPTRRRFRDSFRVRLGGTAACLLAGVALTGCGGSSGASSATPAASASGLSGAARGGSQGTVPGAFGTAAEISGHTIEVQNPSTGQVSVTFTASTRFTQTRTVTSAALKVGECVTAVGVRDAGSPSTSTSGSASGSASGSPGSSPGAPKAFAAGSVSISAAVDGSCRAGGPGAGTGFRGGNRPSGSPTARPSGSGSGRFGGGFGGGNFASGQLTALTPTSMSVKVTGRGTDATGTDTVTLTPATTYSQTVAVAATALRVGQCVAATGPTDTKGAVAATRITLSTAGPNGCSAGFGRRGGAAPSTSPTGG